MSNGQNNDITTQYNEDTFGMLTNSLEQKIRTDYKIVDVKWLDLEQVQFKIFGDPYFSEQPTKTAVINDMANYYVSHVDSPIYKKTDYLCNTQEKMCICNTNADAFRKIYEAQNYNPNKKYISYIQKNINY